MSWISTSLAASALRQPTNSQPHCSGRPGSCKGGLAFLVPSADQIASLPLRAQNLNLAYCKTITTSSVQNADYKAENATDGNCNTRWSSEFADSQYLVIDLSTVQTIDRVRLTWEAAYGNSFILQVSSNPSDDKAWKMMQSVTGNISIDRGATS
jgi:hypothetical protein